MKTRTIKLLSAIAIALVFGCGSGQQSPVDSHPGSGSVKEDSDPKDSKSADSAKADSTTTYTE